MAKYVRVSATPTDDKSLLPFYFDVLIDEKDLIVGDHPIFGFQGQFERGGNSLPLILYHDGRTDYGDAYDSPSERYGQIDLREGPICEGRIFSYRGYQGSGNDQFFRIAEIALLAKT